MIWLTQKIKNNKMKYISSSVYIQEYKYILFINVFLSDLKQMHKEKV